MNIALWVVQVLVGLAFLIAGWTKAFQYQRARQQMAWVPHVPRDLTRFIGAAEILGGIGLVVPAATHILPWLTPLAAAGLAVIMVLAIAFHASRGEWRALPASVSLGLLALVVVAGRVFLQPL
jgi:uncharacterized membrane protein YphA (DoxX/SURF4 family)